ncbi:hypothetical protein ACEUZ9_002790 [Paracoccus litorisediminis]|uniref:hypothetical protein n=1 Tax=Paracoccus litorisediminis TaxID=2006130 RepID=UPI00372F5465
MNAPRQIPQPDPEEMLTDVRHAYRVVAAYQQKIFFMLRQIEAGFPELVFANWYPVWNDRPAAPKTRPWQKPNWDFLPLHAVDYWFVQSGTAAKDPLDLKGWFMTVRVSVDDGYSDELATSASFSGPDPMKMDPVEETDTFFHIEIYQVTKKAGKGLAPWDVWQADCEERDESVWYDLPTVGARCIFFGGSLADYIQPGGIETLIAEVRTRLVKDGLLAKPGK